jgi:hypothetical protein
MAFLARPKGCVSLEPAFSGGTTDEKETALKARRAMQSIGNTLQLLPPPHALASQNWQ